MHFIVHCVSVYTILLRIFEYNFILFLVKHNFKIVDPAHPVIKVFLLNVFLQA